MKKLIGILGVAMIAMTMFFSTNVMTGSNGDLVLDNIIAMNEANAEDVCIDCAWSSNVCAWVEGYGNVYGTVTGIYYC